MKGKIFALAILFLILATTFAFAAEFEVGNGEITADDVPANGTFITALYRDGRMVDMTMQSGSEYMIVDPLVEFGEVRDNDIIKSFLWDMDTMAPLCRSLTTNLQEINERDNTVTITVNGQSFTAVLYENETAKAFQEMLPMTITMNELNGNEKYFYFDRSLPTDSIRPGTIHEGDLMLYGSNCLVLFYETFQSSYSYTKIGYIEDVLGLQNALGAGNVTVRFE